MSQDLIAVADRLADTLEAENAALTALDLPRAASMLADKQRVVAEFLAAREALGDNPAAAAQFAGFEPLVRRLELLSRENRTLLERALTVQRRVIGVIARAAAPAMAASNYCPRGAGGYATRPTAFALAARA